MVEKDVLLLLTDKWADWEASYAIAEVNSVPHYSVKTIALDKESKSSIGGLRAEIDFLIEEYTDLSNLALVILPGGFSWQDNRYEEIARFIKHVLDQNIPIAAICGATIFLGSHGLLDQVKHTGDSFEFFEAQDEYNGATNFLEAQAIRDKNIITANETAAVEFAYEIYKLLEIDEPKELEAWYDNFKNGFVR
ncbi:putative enzyme [Carnobacterium sp. 17-4]|uniref:type 1 glutamine amidotransferase family protein n=1 Tax=Carnobacterium sp. (strain 17-4) TaxID=208596 RepID=UPI00020592F7|nr:type 1 glutamine amidotransferase family protein [Carnobacterium sp. 17-4]AEB29228.1 putative enzyme [Carnobacterium sp. 17-4]